jgi:hypothetical protein
MWHAPIVAARAEVLRIRRYVQSYTFQDLRFSVVSTARGEMQPYDGVAELWWDTIEDCLGRTDPAARRAGREILEDEAEVRRPVGLADLPRARARDRALPRRSSAPDDCRSPA